MYFFKTKFQLQNNRFFLSILAFLLFTSWGLWAHADEQKLLRSNNTACGIYLTRLAQPKKHIEDSMGKPLSLSLNPEDFEKFLDSQPGGLEIPPDAKIAIVGAPWERSKRADLEKQVGKALADRGFTNVPVQSIRQLVSWSQRVQGVFQEVDGKWIKVSDATPWGIRKALEKGNIVNGRPTLVVGAPVIGPDAKRFDEFIAKSFEHYESQTVGQNFTTQVTKQSVVGAMITQAFKQPLEFLTYLTRRVRSVAFMKEDYQVPTAEENAKAIEKLVVPGGLTAVVMTIQSFLGGRPLSIVLPTTIINGLNSYATGRWRNTLQNWTRRSLSVFPDQFFKDVILSTFFTANIYFMGDPGRWASVMDAAAWQTFFATKWLSVLFNASWRAPNGMVVASWERYAVEELHRTPKAVRHAGSTISKYTSYLMTQFYIYSIITQDALFKVAQIPGGGVGVFPNDSLPEGVTELMSFNVGHAAMAACGVLSACISFARGPQTAIADLALRVDKQETRFINWVFGRKSDLRP